MFAPDDTIAAIATPPGRGGIGVVRIGGPGAPGIARALLPDTVTLIPRFATFTRFHINPDAPGDEVVVTWFAAPASYTGQDVVEISAHGSPVILQAIVQAAIERGARAAQPGEFTLRAYLNGKRDLVQAEAVADLVEAATPLQARVAFDQLEGTLTRRIADIDRHLFDLIVRLEASLDFPDEGYHFIEPHGIAAATGAAIDALDDLLADASRGRMIREGATVVVAGRTNVGKSSLFNALAGADRAIVTDVPGTTRDLVSERVDIEGLPVTLVDTAGAREAIDIVEREGVARGVQARAIADLVLLVIDSGEPLTDEDERLLEDTRRRARLIVANKMDRPRHDDMARVEREADTAPVQYVSAATAEGLRDLRIVIARMLTGRESLRDTAAISNVRHIALLRGARAHLIAARDAAAAGATGEEFLLSDLQAARRAFDDIVGTRTADDILEQVFARFCIGK